MSARQQGRRAKFARRMRDQRIVRRIRRTHSSRTGFIGTVLRWTLTESNGRSQTFGPGAVFVQPAGASVEIAS